MHYPTNPLNQTPKPLNQTPNEKLKYENLKNYEHTAFSSLPSIFSLDPFLKRDIFSEKNVHYLMLSL